MKEQTIGLMKAIHFQNVMNECANASLKIMSLVKACETFNGDTGKLMIEIAKVADEAVIKLEMACKNYLDETRTKINELNKMNGGSFGTSTNGNAQ